MDGHDELDETRGKDKGKGNGGNGEHDNNNDNDTPEWGLHKVSTLAHGHGWRGRDLNKKSVLNCGNPAQTCQAGRVINICSLTDGCSHRFKKRMCEFMNSWLDASDPPSVDVLFRHIAAGVLRQENHLCLLDFDLNRDGFTPPH